MHYLAKGRNVLKLCHKPHYSGSFSTETSMAVGKLKLVSI